MNIENYIASGVLEAYVLAELSASEAAEVERLANLHPEIKREISLIEETMEALANAGRVAPRATLKNEFFQRFDQTVQVKTPQPPKETVVRELPAPTANPWRWVAAAAITLTVISSVMAIYYRGKWQSVEHELFSLLAQQEVVAQEYNKVNLRLKQIEENLDIINNADFAKINLPGTPNSPDALTLVYWNPQSTEVYLSVQRLKQLSAEQQYQLWAIIDGKPVDAGVFDATDNPYLLKMKDIPAGAQAFAVTIEPKGGSENPSLETMQVYGALKPA